MVVDIKTTIGAVASVVALGIGADIVKPYFADAQDTDGDGTIDVPAGSLNDQKANWTAFKNVYFASLILGTLMGVAE